jgi:hypothetical protein
VSDELFARLTGCYDEAQIVELTAAVALENFRSKFNVPLQVQAQGFCALPGLHNAADSGRPLTGGTP